MFQKVENILRCPRTGHGLTLDESGTHYQVKDSDDIYPVVDGIVDFLPNQSDKISRAYDRLASLYERIITNSNGLISLFNALVWGQNDDHLYSEVVPAYLPDNFSGVLLDVPVGTGVFTVDKYRQLGEATIIVVDYSLEMLHKTKQRFAENKIANAVFVHGDVSRLPITNLAVDIVFSMCGLHAFADKNTALTEIDRVLKPGGQFSGCFYIKGQRRTTDLIISHIYSRVGTFSRPFYTKAEARDVLSTHFRLLESKNVRSMFVFDARKQANEA